MDGLHRSPVARVVAWALVVSLAAAPCGEALAQVQDSAVQKMKRAETQFDEGDFDKSIATLEELLRDSGLATVMKQQAYELLAANYMAKTYLERARGAIRSLLTLVPNYKPDPERYSPSFVEQVDRVRAEMQREKELAQQPPPETPPETPPEQPPAPPAAGGKEEKAAESSWLESPWTWVAGGVVVGGVVALVVLNKGTDGGTAQKGTPLPNPPTFP